ncbi:MAG: glycine--tRNA ligase [Proteobacteria bacterium]|nr:glycine--tRNA ligase [Pseudomonadota bacterium]
MDLMTKVVSLCKRRGFVFQSSEIYGGLKSFYDYGPLGVDLKKNIAKLWWDDMVDNRENVVGLDSSIIMHPRVWQSSGHVSNFSDPLVDCLNCKARFRGDKQPSLAPGSTVTWRSKASGDNNVLKTGQVGDHGYVCPECGCPHLSQPRDFSGLFKTFLGAVDPLSCINPSTPPSQAAIDHLLSQTVYLRPETAQAMFIQFLNVQKSMGLKVPFGIAQHGKSFRNEIVVEHFIFRSCEFEQMEMEFFCEPGTEKEWLSYWSENRLSWYQKYGNHRDNFRLRAHDSSELAHYSDACYDIEYQYPWGWDELEGVASRGDYDLHAHSQGSKAKLSYFDPKKTDPATGKVGWRYMPKVIEPAAGLTRAFLCFLLDAYSESRGVTSTGEEKNRFFLNLHPLLAPYKAAILPLSKDDGLMTLAHSLGKEWRKSGLKLTVDGYQSIGKRYAKHDEIGTPYAVTVDHQSLVDHHVTVRNRNTTHQVRVPFKQAQLMITESLERR